MRCVLYRMARFRSERAGIVDDVAGGKRAKRRVEVIEARVGQLQGYAGDTKMVGDDRRGGAVGTAPHPKLLALVIPDAVAGALKDHISGQLHDVLDLRLRTQAVKGVGEDRFLALALGIAEA